MKQGHNKKENYRPFTLMNKDTKNSIKYLPTEFNNILKTIQHHKVGFILGMQGCFNTCKSVNVI
jgi:hypothetical protein